MSEHEPGSPQVESRIVVDRKPVVPASHPRVLITNDDGYDAPESDNSPSFSPTTSTSPLPAPTATAAAPAPASGSSTPVPGSRCGGSTWASSTHSPWTARPG